MAESEKGKLRDQGPLGEYPEWFGKAEDTFPDGLNRLLGVSTFAPAFDDLWSLVWIIQFMVNKGFLERLENTSQRRRFNRIKDEVLAAEAMAKDELKKEIRGFLHELETKGRITDPRSVQRDRYIEKLAKGLDDDAEAAGTRNKSFDHRSYLDLVQNVMERATTDAHKIPKTSAFHLAFAVSPLAAMCGRLLEPLLEQYKNNEISGADYKTAEKTLNDLLMGGYDPSHDPVAMQELQVIANNGFPRSVVLGGEPADGSINLKVHVAANVSGRIVTEVHEREKKNGKPVGLDPYTNGKLELDSMAIASIAAWRAVMARSIGIGHPPPVNESPLLKHDDVLRLAAAGYAMAITMDNYEHLQAQGAAQAKADSIEATRSGRDKAPYMGASL